MYKLPERDQFNLFQMGKFNSKFEQLELFPEIDYIQIRSSIILKSRMFPCVCCTILSVDKINFVFPVSSIYW